MRMTIASLYHLAPLGWKMRTLHFNLSSSREEQSVNYLLDDSLEVVLAVFA
jgi:hypothetical protein